MEIEEGKEKEEEAVKEIVKNRKQQKNERNMIKIKGKEIKGKDKGKMRRKNRRT